MRTVAAVLILGVAFTYAQDSSEWGQGGGRLSTNCSCGWTNKESGRIVGGRNTGVNEYPLIAGLCNRGRPNFLFCGGTIITKRHVVTAAHCKPKSDQAVDVVLAEHDTRSNTESKTVVVQVSQFINHEQYNAKSNIENDVALLVLATDIPFDTTIGPACFPKANLNLVGQKVRVIGWGTLFSKGPKSQILQKVDLDVQPVSACSKIYKGITEGQLCTYSFRKDACQGDSGGPVIWLDPATNRYTVVGIVSYGYGCAQDDTPGVNTAVSAYRDWILQKIGETAPSATTCAAP